MFQVGDLVRFPPSATCNDIPGLVVGIVYDNSENRECLKVQWFDWEPGELANEDTEALVLVSSVSEGK